MVAARPRRVYDSCSFIMVAHSGGCSFMVAACSWRLLIHGSCLFMAAARSWRLLIHGGCLFMVAARSWWPLVHGVSIAVAHS